MKKKKVTMLLLQTLQISVLALGVVVLLAPMLDLEAAMEEGKLSLVR